MQVVGEMVTVAMVGYVDTRSVVVPSMVMVGRGAVPMVVTISHPCSSGSVSVTVNQLVPLMFLLATASLVYENTTEIGAVDVGTGVIGVFPYRTSIEDEKVSLTLV